MTGSLQIKNGKYYAVLNFKDKEGKRKQKWVATGLDIKNNKRKAEQMLNEIINEYADTDYIEPTKILFCDFVKKWIELNKPNLQVTTYDGYIHMLNKHIYPYFKEKGITLNKIKPIDIQHYYTHKMESGLSPNTVTKHHGVIRSCIAYAVKNNMIKENVADYVDKPKKEKFHVSWYSVNEIRALFSAAKGSTIETPVLLASYYGLRRSEVLGLKWDCIDFEHKTVSIERKVVRGKDDEGKLVSISQDKMKSETSRRTMPLCADMAEYLTALLEKQENNVRIMGNCYNHEYDGYICVNDMGDLIKPDYVTATFKKLLDTNKLRHIRFHDLRHSCASLLVSMGFNLKDVQEWLGHADFTVTANTYSHVDMAEKIRMADAVNKKFTFTSDSE